MIKIRLKLRDIVSVENPGWIEFPNVSNMVINQDGITFSYWWEIDSVMYSEEDVSVSWNLVKELTID